MGHTPRARPAGGRPAYSSRQPTALAAHTLATRASTPPSVTSPIPAVRRMTAITTSPWVCGIDKGSLCKVYLIWNVLSEILFVQMAMRDSAFERLLADCLRQLGAEVKVGRARRSALERALEETLGQQSKEEKEK